MQTKQFPEDLKIHIYELTKGHVGYTSCILHTLQIYGKDITQQSEAISFLRSTVMYKELESQRPVPNYHALTLEQKEALKTVWKSGDHVHFRDHSEYMNLARKGWFVCDNQSQTVSLPCPLSKQLILMTIQSNFQQPETDNFQSLDEFMNLWLTTRNAAFFKDTLVHAKVKRQDVHKTVIEACWRYDFYSFGRSNLGKDYTVGIEVNSGSYLTDKNEELPFEITGFLDFYINKSRQWAVEFLIRGEKKNKNVSSLSTHTLRFQSTGSYHSLPKKASLVIDFRPSSYGPYSDIKNDLQPADNFIIPVWVVIYDDLQWSSLQVYKFAVGGKRISTESIVLL